MNDVGSVVAYIDAGTKGVNGESISPTAPKLRTLNGSFQVTKQLNFTGDPFAMVVDPAGQSVFVNMLNGQSMAVYSTKPASGLSYLGDISTTGWNSTCLVPNRTFSALYSCEQERTSSGVTARVVKRMVADVTALRTTHVKSQDFTSETDAVAVSPDGTKAYVILESGEIYELRTSDMTTLRKFTAVIRPAQYTMQALSITPDGQSLLTIEPFAHNTLVFVSTATGEETRRIRLGPFSRYDLDTAVSPNGGLVYVSTGWTLQGYSIATGRLVNEISFAENSDTNGSISNFRFDATGRFMYLFFHRAGIVRKVTVNYPPG